MVNHRRKRIQNVHKTIGMIVQSTFFCRSTVVRIVVFFFVLQNCPSSIHTPIRVHVIYCKIMSRSCVIHVSPRTERIKDAEVLALPTCNTARVTLTIYRDNSLTPLLLSRHDVRTAVNWISMNRALDLYREK